MSENSFRAGDIAPVPPKKRARVDLSAVDTISSSTDAAPFCPENMHLMSVLQNDLRNKSLVLHTRFGDDSKEAIVTLQKSSFPSDPDTLKRCKVVNKLLSLHTSNGTVDQSRDQDKTGEIDNVTFPQWQAKSIMTNDIYHRFFITNGLELVNGIDMTVIYPAESHHFTRYTNSRRLLFKKLLSYIKMYSPFLVSETKDLTWIDNEYRNAEQDRTLHNHIDEVFGFTLVLDYRWDGVRIQELHCLGIAHDQKLTCIRDLRSCHVPMLRNMLQLGRDSLFSKYSKSISSDNQLSDNSNILSSKDQILAYIHYPPTFYRLHIHFVHIDSGDNYGTNACRAHILEEVIRNLEQDDLYYANRTITMFLHTNSPMFTAICESSYHESVVNPVSE
uniref:m7GpppX diphosphatase n=1 Tax=Schistosoma japonicum TaxID=6182 RepID=Q5DGH0_SCHJA|nr:SJCHGC09282 protein [Schistosoma japonicum]